MTLFAFLFKINIYNYLVLFSTASSCILTTFFRSEIAFLCAFLLEKKHYVNTNATVNGSLLKELYRSACLPDQRDRAQGMKQVSYNA